MPEIHYKDFKEYLAKLRKNEPEGVYLIFGESFLVDIVRTGIIDILIPPSEREFNYEKVDLDESQIEAVLESVSTYSFFPETKVISVSIDQLFSKSIAASKNEDAYDGEAASMLKDDADVLEAAIKNGFPNKHILILSAEKVDKRRTLFKTIKKAGMVIDCSIPHGNRMADRKAQEAVLFECMKMIVSGNGKSMGKRAFDSLLDSTGFDLPVFSKNLEKLVTYVGERIEITEDDVAALISRTKKDPIFELSNSISEKNIDKALFLVNSLLEDGLYPLQILAGITNHIRKLLLVKDFTQTMFGSDGEKQADMSYDYFKHHIFAAMLAFDSELKHYIEKEENLSAGESDTSGSSENKGTKTDLVLAKNPNNPYPVYQTFRAAARFTKNELVTAMEQLSLSDILLKTTGQNPGMVMDRLIFKICGMSC